MIDYLLKITVPYLRVTFKEASLNSAALLANFYLFNVNLVIKHNN
jgi:hypothetical protein